VKTWGAREWVAILLAVSVLAILSGTVLKGLLMSDRMPLESTEVVADTVKVIIGGLIGYIAGKNGNDNGKSGPKTTPGDGGADDHSA